MPNSIPVPTRERRARMREAREAIVRLLHAEYVPMLTEPLPTELRHLIAQLVAHGLSNREIGERLYLSHRTIGSNLYRIFPKLGVRTRAQLHEALGRETGAG